MSALQPRYLLVSIGFLLSVLSVLSVLQCVAVRIKVVCVGGTCLVARSTLLHCLEATDGCKEGWQGGIVFWRQQLPLALNKTPELTPAWSVCCCNTACACRRVVVTMQGET